MAPETRRPPGGAGKSTTGETEPGRATPETAAQALERARVHARRALSEAIAAAHALLDAASIGWSGRPGEAHGALRGLTDLLDEQTKRFADGEAGVPTPVMNAILEAVEQEITRWENRAATDAEARAVLRTFLGLREILWEFGLRREDTAASGKPASEPRGKQAAKRKSNTGTGRSAAPAGRRGRVQRIDVQG
jgi:hypothetical protein